MPSWRDFLTGHGLELREPAREADIAATEQALDVRLPDAVRALLLETDGVFTEYGEAVVAPCADIVTATRELWALDAEHIYMTLAPHVFFGDELNGDRYFFRVLGHGSPDFDIFRWDHEDDTRTQVDWHLQRYVIERAEALPRDVDPGFDLATTDALLDCVAFLALSDDDAVDPDAAVRQLESVAATLKAGPDLHRRGFVNRAQTLAADEPNPERAELLRNVGENLGL